MVLSLTHYEYQCSVNNVLRALLLFSFYNLPTIFVINNFTLNSLFFQKIPKMKAIKTNAFPYGLLYSGPYNLTPHGFEMLQN